ncbi:hypothetical protein CHS0354_003878 [Potamilus streckersoni]|uniref:Uncharacterized protein n=1 Tax=Potamilus streckersoni TaxID=2493646 RepID=A0AAE0WEH1_9BIVA|nr:hypothetical protein CHS0354_003878 [Potamilus streckersoni]
MALSSLEMRYRRVLEGCTDNLPEKECRSVRVFISSTFTDTTVERNFLMKNSIPRLRTFCQEAGLDFEAVDLRWGVRDEAQDDHSTVETVLKEVIKCQKVSVGPNFVSFLGDKYGYRPVVSKIEAKEFKILRNAAASLGFDVSLLDTWYCRDINAYPPEYVLLPISTVISRYTDTDPSQKIAKQNAEWWVVSEKLTEILRCSADKAFQERKLNEEERHKYYQSVTEAEVRLGILNAGKVDNKVLVYLRYLQNIDLKSKIADRYIDQKNGKVDFEAEDLREKLRLHVGTVIPEDQQKTFRVDFLPEGIQSEKEDHGKYLCELDHHFESTLKKMIKIELQQSAIRLDMREVYTEVLHHLHFCEKKNRTFCGREEVLGKVRALLFRIYTNEEVINVNEKDDDTQMEETESEEREAEDQGRVGRISQQKALEEFSQQFGISFHHGDLDDMESDPSFDVKKQLIQIKNFDKYSKPIVLYGESGIGKTALMAKIMELAEQWFPDSFRIIRFLGTSPKSTAIQRVLFSICSQIWQIYGIPKPAEVESYVDFQYLVSYFAALLWKVGASKRHLFILLDSVDQLNPSDHSYMLGWVPMQLPVNVHLIISVLPDMNGCLTNMRNRLVDEEQYVQINRLEENVADDIITILCQESGRQLMRNQRNLLLEKYEKCGQPLYLKLLVSQALQWKSYTKISDDMLGATVQAAIHNIFDNLERKHGSIVIRKALGYLCASRDGLSETEMVDILSLDDDVLQDTFIYHLPPDPKVIMYPPFLWKRIQYDLEDYLAEKESGGKRIITWYHRQFHEVSATRFITNDNRKNLHIVLAEYFQGTWNGKEKKLLLTKGKKGSYPDAIRSVAAQPIKFANNMYNKRKLIELPYHLIQSEQFDSLLSDCFGNCDWLYAKCHAVFFTALIEDVKLALEKMAGLGLSDLEVYHHTNLMKKLLTLGSESIRKDAANVVIQVLSQLGPGNQSNSHFERLVQSAKSFCARAFGPLLTPQEICLPQLHGSLILTIQADISLAGADRSDLGHMCFDDAHNHLYVVQQKNNENKDQLLVFDLNDNGSCVIKTDLDMALANIHLCGEGRFLKFDVYEKMDKYSPESSEELLHLSSLSPVQFPTPVSYLAVSSSGKFIATASDTENILQVFKVSKEISNLLTLLHRVETKAPAFHLAISPDDRFVIAAFASSVFAIDLKKGTELFKLQDLDYKYIFRAGSLNFEILTHITRSNILISSDRKTLVVSDLNTRDKKHALAIGDPYKISFLRVHSSEKFILVGSNEDMIKNGNRTKFAQILSMDSGTCVSRSSVNGPYADIQIFGSEYINVVVTPLRDKNIYVLTAGRVQNILKDALVIHCLQGHNMDLVQVLISPDEKLIISAAEDNMIKVWNLGQLMEDFITFIQEPQKKQQETVSPQLIRPPSEEDHDHRLYQRILEYSARKMSEKEAMSQSTALVMDSNGVTAYLGTDHGEVLKYTVESSCKELLTNKLSRPVKHMLLSRNDKYIIVITDKADIFLLNSIDGAQIRKLKFASRNVDCAAEANNILVVGMSGMEAKGQIWNIETGAVLKEFSLLYSLSCVAINSTGTKIVSTLFEFPLLIPVDDSNAGGNIFMENMDIMMAGAICVVVSPDDRFAGCTSSDGSIRVIKMDDGQYIHRMQQRSSAVALTFSRDSKCILTAGFRSLYIWSLEDGSLQCKLSRHSDFILGIKFDRSGKYLVTSSRDKKIIVWDYKRAVSIATFNAQCQVKLLEVGPDARTIVYVPDNNGHVVALRPNRYLEKLLEGQHLGPTVKPEVQGISLAFSSQSRSIENTKACEVM